MKKLMPLYAVAAGVGLGIGMWLRHPAKLEIIESRGGTYEVYSNQVEVREWAFHGADTQATNRFTARSNRMVTILGGADFRLGANAACAAMLEGVATNVEQIIERACWLQTNNGKTMLW